MSRVGLAGTDVEDIHDRVHALNELVQKQLEEADRRLMKLQGSMRRIRSSRCSKCSLWSIG